MVGREAVVIDLVAGERRLVGGSGGRDGVVVVGPLCCWLLEWGRGCGFLLGWRRV